MMQSYRDLAVYNLAHELGLKIHKLSLKLPKYELYETGSQIRRSSKAISGNIVEGYARKRYKSDFIRFLVYTHASCDETIEWLKYLDECYSEMSSEIKQIMPEIEKLSKK